MEKSKARRNESRKSRRVCDGALWGPLTMKPSAETLEFWGLSQGTYPTGIQSPMGGATTSRSHGQQK